MCPPNIHCMLRFTRNTESRSFLSSFLSAAWGRLSSSTWATIWTSWASWWGRAATTRTTQTSSRAGTSAAGSGSTLRRVTARTATIRHQSRRRWYVREWLTGWHSWLRLVTEHNLGQWRTPSLPLQLEYTIFIHPSLMVTLSGCNIVCFPCRTQSVESCWSAAAACSSSSSLLDLCR